VVILPTDRQTDRRNLRSHAGHLPSLYLLKLLCYPQLVLEGRAGIFWLSFRILNFFFLTHYRLVQTFGAPGGCGSQNFETTDT
jgi:hypothetical protein